MYLLFGKRIVDLFLTIPALILFSPVIAIIALFVKFKLGGSIFFKQQRPGRNGVPFTIYKFRTMTDTRYSDGTLRPDAERLTKFGSLLRSTSLDELPELFNILKGDMSLVGPRPLLMQYLTRYTLEQARRHDVRPGITGWAQINGRNAITWEKRFEFDLWYIDHCTLWLDIKIILLTVYKVIKREGISEEGMSTMSEFLGTKTPVQHDEK